MIRQKRLSAISVVIIITYYILYQLLLTLPSTYTPSRNVSVQPKHVQLKQRDVLNSAPPSQQGFQWSTYSSSAEKAEEEEQKKIFLNHTLHNVFKKRQTRSRSNLRRLHGWIPPRRRQLRAVQGRHSPTDACHPRTPTTATLLHRFFSAHRRAPSLFSDQLICESTIASNPATCTTGSGSNTVLTRGAHAILWRAVPELPPNPHGEVLHSSWTKMDSRRWRRMMNQKRNKYRNRLALPPAHLHSLTLILNKPPANQNKLGTCVEEPVTCFCCRFTLQITYVGKSLFFFKKPSTIEILLWPEFGFWLYSYERYSVVRA